MKCDACGESLKDDSGIYKNVTVSPQTVTALHIAFPDEGEAFGDHKEYRRARKLYGKSSFNFCYCCCLKALGAHETKKE